MGTKEAVFVAAAIKANQDPLIDNKETNVACEFAIRQILALQKKT